MNVTQREENASPMIQNRPKQQRQFRRHLPMILPMPGANPMPAPAPKRTRAKRSCDYCRKRKTRCNADETWPCSACKGLEIDCNIGQLTPSEPSRTTYVEALENRVKRLEGILGDSNSPEKVTAAAADSSLGSAHSHSNNNGDPTTALTNDMNQLSLSDYEKTLYIGGSAGFYMLDQKAHEDHEMRGQKLNDDLDEHVILKSEDVHSRQKEAIMGNSFPFQRFFLFSDIPMVTHNLADSMIQAYFHHVHPYAPMISKIAFLEQYYFQNPHPPDEYLVYAICAIACQFMIREGNPIIHYGVSPETLLSLHQVFREKAEKLLTVVYRRSKISTIQTLILLATFVNTSQDKDDDMLQWFTCGTAIRMAQDLGLHRSSSRWRLPDTEIELRRRVWYAAYILDREISAELGRPVTVSDDDFDVEIPTPNELEFPHCLYARDPETSKFMPQILLDAEADVFEKRETYKSFVANCHLAKIMGKVLHTLNSPKGQQIYRANPTIISEIDGSLAKWAAKLPTDHSSLDQQTEALTRAMMIHYHCLQILLHRVCLGNRDSSNIQFALQALSASTTSATKIIELVEEGEACGHICLPWSIVSYSVFQAALVFLFNAKGENEYLRGLGAKNLVRCAYIYTKDETYRDSRPAKLLMSLASRFSVQMDQQPSPPQQHQLQQESRKRNFGAVHSDTFESVLADSTPFIHPPSNLSSPEKHNYGGSGGTLFYPELTDQNLFTPSVPSTEPSQAVYLSSNSNVQFDLAGLSSEVALWNASSGMTWNDWDPYLHNNPSPPQQQH